MFNTAWWFAPELLLTLYNTSITVGGNLLYVPSCTHNFLNPTTISQHRNHHHSPQNAKTRHQPQAKPHPHSTSRCASTRPSNSAAATNTRCPSHPATSSQIAPATVRTFRSLSSLFGIERELQTYFRSQRRTSSPPELYLATPPPP